MKNITHVIFDNDGLLVDTEQMYSDMIQLMLDDYGVKFTKEIKIKQMGRPTREAGEVLINSLNLSMKIEEYEDKLHILRPQFFPSCELMSGAEKLVNHLHNNNINIAIATSAERSSFNLKITKHVNLFSKFSHIVCGSDEEIGKGKPAPDIYCIASKRFKIVPKPENVLVFEDAFNGVQAGLAAGMHVVWVVDMRFCPLSKQELEEHKSDRLTIIYNLNEFKPEMFNLPAL